jgi:hypothetical protein
MFLSWLLVGIYQLNRDVFSSLSAGDCAGEPKKGGLFDEMMGTLRTAEDPDRLYRQRASKGKNRWKWIDIASGRQQQSQ